MNFWILKKAKVELNFYLTIDKTNTNQLNQYPYFSYHSSIKNENTILLNYQEFKTAKQHSLDFKIDFIEKVEKIIENILKMED